MQQIKTSTTPCVANAQSFSAVFIASSNSATVTALLLLQLQLLLLLPLLPQFGVVNEVKLKLGLTRSFSGAILRAVALQRSFTNSPYL